jgi:methylthioribulose-1-phosphate dehydratase
MKRRERGPQKAIPFRVAAREIAEISKAFYSRGWVLGTSGNFSAVIQREPLRLAITACGLDKGSVSLSQIVEIDASAKVRRGAPRKASAEALIHLAIVRERAAGAVLHTHSICGTVLSEAHAGQGAVVLQGYEMLKGLEGVHSHQHTERLPIVENSQNMEELSAEIGGVLAAQPEIHGLLLRKHGLYTWGANLREAKRHVEIIEFLMEVLVRSGSAGISGKI